jgi:hypothetical protein
MMAEEQKGLMMSGVPGDVTHFFAFHLKGAWVLLYQAGAICGIKAQIPAGGGGLSICTGDKLPGDSMLPAGTRGQLILTRMKASTWLGTDSWVGVSIVPSSQEQPVAPLPASNS